MDMHSPPNATATPAAPELPDAIAPVNAWTDLRLAGALSDMNNPTRAMICVAMLVAPPFGAAQDTRTELQSHPGCHVDGLTFEGDVDVAWTGACSGEWADGPGVVAHILSLNHPALESDYLVG